MPDRGHRSRTEEAELLDVVLLVIQAVWSEWRRAGRTIEATQWTTLRRIDRAPCTMSDLARYKGVGLPTISKSVDALVRRGWVERWVDKSDRRQTLVRVTVSGRRMIAACRREMEELLAIKLTSLTPSERKRLRASLETVKRALRFEAP